MQRFRCLRDWEHSMQTSLLCLCTFLSAIWLWTFTQSSMACNRLMRIVKMSMCNLGIMHCISLAILSHLSLFPSAQLAQIDLSVLTNQSININWINVLLFKLYYFICKSVVVIYMIITTYVFEIVMDVSDIFRRLRQRFTKWPNDVTLN